MDYANPGRYAIREIYMT